MADSTLPPTRRVVLAGLAGLVGCRDDAPQPHPQGTPPAAEPKKTGAGVSAAPSALRVEIIHDTVCPWCRIGCHNLHTAIDALGQRVEVIYRPYLLAPETPDEGVDLREWLGKKYGAGRVSGMFTGVTEAGARHGVRFDFDRVRVSPQTAFSHALIDWAPAEQRRALVTALHAAYFENGQNIGDLAVLASIAQSVGLDPAAARAAASDRARVAAVRQQASAAQSSGIGGVPHFISGSRTLHGAQSPETIRKSLLGA